MTIAKLFVLHLNAVKFFVCYWDQKSCFLYNFVLISYYQDVIKRLDKVFSKNVHSLFHDSGSCQTETSPLICSGNQWTGSYMIGISQWSFWSVKFLNFDILDCYTTQYTIQLNFWILLFWTVILYSTLYSWISEFYYTRLFLISERVEKGIWNSVKHLWWNFWQK